MAIAFYVSGHGFGHASRQIEILNALATAAPDVRVIVRTSAARWLFDRTAAPRIELQHAECDTGVAQLDSLRLDERATVARAADFHRTFGARGRAEADLLQRAGVRLVVCDAPPLACAAAASAGIPAFVVANFTWDWIYAEYREHLHLAPGLLDEIRAAYAQAAGAWRLPMHGGFESIATICDIPFVARHARREPADVRRRLNLPPSQPLILWSFGGYGLDALRLSTPDFLGDYGVVLTVRHGAAAPERPGMYQVEESRLYGAGLRYEDLVAAVDVVVTKPGYGIIAECIANGTSILYTSRGRFAEYDVLVTDMPRYVRCAFLDREALLAGRWREALDRLAAAPPPATRPRTDGADVVARMIVGRM